MLYEKLITSNNDLEERCKCASNSKWVAMDTEFVRTRNYYPKLGLIQLYDGASLMLIDPLAITNWQPFIDLLTDINVNKVLHACSEDLEVFLRSFGHMPVPLIDTQVLAAFTGSTLSCGFAALVAEYQQITLDKSESRTDWLARPLSLRQCYYAASDVYWLLQVTHALVAKTRKAGWWEQATQECRSICKRSKEYANPAIAYREIVNSRQLSARQRVCLQRLASWRLLKAREHDIAVNFVVRDENLCKVASLIPGSLEELKQLGLSVYEICFNGIALLEIVHDVVQEEFFLKKIFNIRYKNKLKAIKNRIKKVSNSYCLSRELLASRRKIHKLLSFVCGFNFFEHLPYLIMGWRGELFGDAVINIARII